MRGKLTEAEVWEAYRDLWNRIQFPVRAGWLRPKLHVKRARSVRSVLDRFVLQGKISMVKVPHSGGVRDENFYMPPEVYESFQTVRQVRV